MTSTAAPVTFSVDADGVGWIVFNDPVARVNLLNPLTLVGLREALREAAAPSTGAASALKAVVATSAKERIFIAGADIHRLSQLRDEAEACAMAREGQALFTQIAASRVPVVCAIRGACAGGGFEFALACHWRLASDEPSTRIGLPETGLGVIPGWGGCVRLPRLIGAAAALDHLLKARLVPAAEALKTGLVDELIPAGELHARAKEAALRLAAAVASPAGLPKRRDPNMPTPEWFASLTQAVAARTHGREPALLAAIETVEKGATLPVAEALEIEARAFGRVAIGEVAKNRMRIFFLGESAKNRTLEGWFPASGPKTPPVARIGVVGAGVMGSGIAQWLAAHGLEVVLRDVKEEWVERGLGVVRGLFDDSVRRGGLAPAEAAAGMGRIVGTTSWDGFERCDLVIEAATEDAAAKRLLFSDLAAVARADAILASNTSALPIEEIAGHVPQPERTLGIHFFNPVGRMPLVELVLGRATSAGAAARALALVKRLGKSPVVCRSSPGFLVTRVLFFYLNDAVRLWEQGVPAETIDGALREFGWPMGPLRLIDEVGVDVTEAIFKEMAHYFPGRFLATGACGRMLEAGFKGRKGSIGSGFYLHGQGLGRSEALNVSVHPPIPVRDAGRGSPSSPREIVDRLMETMIGEARCCLEEGVVRSSDDVDFALLSGAGFPAFRGGLMRYAAAKAF